MADLAVLVPTVNRADVLQPLCDNIAQTTTVSHTTYLIVENSDRETIEVLWHLKGDQVCVFGNFGSCAKAMNAGFEASTEPYVFTANDDLRFHDGWELPAFDALEQDKHVCGVNDGHGRMTCFALVRRSYIEQHSGVFDKPRTLYHEYASQYVDTELADYAKHRGVWSEAPDGGVEHMHHDFGKADPNHPNYRKARETCAQDHATFTERRQRWSALPAQAVSSEPTSLLA